MTTKQRVAVLEERSGRLVREDGRNFNIASMFSNNLSPFGEFLTVSPQTIFEIKSIHPLSALRDIQTTNGSGSISHTGTEYQLSTTASANDSAQLRTTERGPYVPGLGGVAGIAARLPSSPTGEQEVFWGFTDGDDGYLFGENSTGVFVARRKGGVETKTYQNNWSVDKLDGGGPSELTLDLADGHIFRIVFSWYGFGTIEWQIVMADKKNEQEVITVHRERVDGAASIDNPTLPITAEVSNSNTASTLDLFIAGRNYSVLGSYHPHTRVNGERRVEQGSIDTTLVPTVSVRIKPGREETPVRIRGFDIISDANLEVVILLDADLTGASFGTPSLTSASETAIEADNSATALTGGEVIWRGFLNASTGTSNRNLRTEEFAGLTLPPNLTTLTVAVRRLSGSNATVSTTFRVKEEW